MRSQKAMRGGRRARQRPPRRKRKKRPTCAVSGKVCFHTELDAVGAMAKISTSPRDGGKAPIRCYRCPDCGTWHLTSQPKR